VCKFGFAVYLAVPRPWTEFLRPAGIAKLPAVPEHLVDSSDHVRAGATFGRAAVDLIAALGPPFASSHLHY